MKKAIALCVAVAMLAGCATSAPERGYYDENGDYHASRSAQNADNLNTAGAVAAGVGIAGALAVGITALHKANKNKHHDDGPDDMRKPEHPWNHPPRPHHTRQPDHKYPVYGDHNHPVNYHGNRY